MGTFGHHLYELIFGHPKLDLDVHRQEWRNAIHENRNAAQVSSAAASKSKKASDEALRVARCAVKLLEQQNSKDKKEDDDGA